MFEIGFSEILVIMALALVVLGPEKLPKVVSEVGRWMGRARSMARQFKEQLEEEVSVESSRSIAQTSAPKQEPDQNIKPPDSSHSAVEDYVNLHESVPYESALIDPVADTVSPANPSS
ncbi:MAG: twin-arginine translocase subunit TatB [Gammaproteobacteria bacterium]|nr:twin-arginine translocase subunit TatB [Gammaproteobacteria bacterium]